MLLANGFMNDTEIQKAITQDEIVICPYDEGNLTPVGYNLSFSRFIVSLRKKAFIKIRKEKDEWCFYLKPNETVLVLTRESIWVSRFIGGTFHSKVSLVTQGLGHVSTTLDPGWQGQLLVPLNNPTRDSIRVVIATESKGVKEYKTFITMVLFRAENSALKDDDNPRPRIELIEQILNEKGNKKNADDLKKIIYEIKQSIGYPKVYKNLNDPTDRIEKINQYKESHEKLLSVMDNAFDLINKISTKSHKSSAVAFWSIVTGIILVLIAIGALGFIICGGIYSGYTNLFIAVIVPFIILGLGHIKDKYV